MALYLNLKQFKKLVKACDIFIYSRKYSEKTKYGWRIKFYKFNYKADAIKMHRTLSAVFNKNIKDGTIIVSINGRIKKDHNKVKTIWSTTINYRR